MKKYRIENDINSDIDLERLFYNIAQYPDSLPRAEQFLRDIKQGMESLTYSPERNQSFRGRRILLVGKYSIVYRITGDLVEILRVVPSSCGYIAKIRGFS